MSIQHIPSCYTIGELLDGFYENLILRCAHAPGEPAALDGDMTIEAIPTWYGGTTFKSRLEADWASTLDTLNIAWEYEPERITLPSGVTYIPDFHLPEIGTWLEVKGTGVPRIEKAIEFGESRICHCGQPCTCDWPGGELVLIGHPPLPYDAWADPQNEGVPARQMHRVQWRHGGHPNWSSSAGPNPWLTKCFGCGRASWFRSNRCRSCGRRLTGYAYKAGDTGLRFVTAGYRPRPAHLRPDVGEAA